MKKLQYNRLLFVGMIVIGMLAATTSCKFEEDDYFSESASLRVEHAIDSVRNIISSAPNGWVFQYFCGTGVAQFEGFNLFANFEKSGKVMLASNHRYLRNGNAGKYTESTSLYSLLLEDGPVLAFNTWNDVLTPFVDPVYYGSAPNTLQKDGEGMQGDHNFVILSYNDDEVILRGERHGAEVRLVKCDTTWQGYIKQCDDMKNRLTKTLSNFYVIGQTDTLYFTGLRNGAFRFCENLTNPVKLDSLACCFTPEGFRIEKEDTIGTDKFHEFRFGEDGLLYNEDATVKVVGVWDDYVISHTPIWMMNSDQFTAEQREIANKMDEEIKKFNAAWSFMGIGIGKSLGSNAVTGLVPCFFTDAAKTESKKRTVGLALDMQKTAYGQVSIDCNDDCVVDNNMKSIVRKATELEILTRQFGQTLNGVYLMTPDDYYTPTGAQFTAQGAGNSFEIK